MMLRGMAEVEDRGEKYTMIKVEDDGKSRVRLRASSREALSVSSSILIHRYF